MGHIYNFNSFNERISLSRYKEWSQYVNKDFYNYIGDYFKRFDDHSNNYDRIYFDLEIDESNFKVTIPDEISDFFAWFGHHGPYRTKMGIVDYNKGICTDKDGREIRIGKLLRNLGEDKLLQTYSKSKENTLKNAKDLQVVISRHPYDIIGMSTDRGWTTCHDLDDKRYGGAHLHNVKNTLKGGCLIAYVIRKSDRNINSPISRCLIYNNRGTLSVDSHIYGTNIMEFNKFLRVWVHNYNSRGKD